VNVGFGSSDPESAPGTLVLIGTPIGNDDDLSPHAKRSPADADVVACEERNAGMRLLRAL
jgi:16S rRNA (cytidine1402-2'-O)-methyltransferase